MGLGGWDDISNTTVGVFFFLLLQQILSNVLELQNDLLSSQASCMWVMAQFKNKHCLFPLTNVQYSFFEARFHGGLPAGKGLHLPKDNKHNSLIYFSDYAIKLLYVWHYGDYAPRWAVSTWLISLKYA